MIGPYDISRVGPYHCLLLSRDEFQNLEYLKEPLSEYYFSSDTMSDFSPVQGMCDVLPTGCILIYGHVVRTVDIMKFRSCFAFATPLEVTGAVDYRISKEYKLELTLEHISLDIAPMEIYDSPLLSVIAIDADEFYHQDSNKVLVGFKDRYRLEKLLSKII